MRYGTVCFFHTRIAGTAMARYRMREWVGPPCWSIGISRSVSGRIESARARGTFMLTFKNFAEVLPVR